MDLRRFLRLHIPCTITYSGYQLLGEGRVVNFSTGGLQIEASQTFRPGTPLLLRMFLGGRQDPIDIELAVVQWARGGRMGLKTIILGDKARTHLRKLVLQHAYTANSEPEYSLIGARSPNPLLVH